MVSGWDSENVYLSAIRRTGDSLHLIDSVGHETICLPSGPSRWVPKDLDSFTLTSSIPDPETVTPTDPAPPNDPDIPSDSTAAAKILGWLKKRLGRFTYSQGAGRLNPDTSGRTDCSGVMYAAFKSVLGINVGTNSRLQAASSRGRTITTNRADILAGRGLERGDLIFYRHPGKAVSHVEMYYGNAKTIGVAPSYNGGPKINPISLQANYFRGPIKARRFL